jgi:biotin carboxyl carrier protein
VPAGSNQEILPAGMKIFHFVPKPHGIAFAGTGTGGSVVQTTTIADDTQHHTPLVGKNVAAGADIGRALRAQRILRSIAFLQIVSAVEQRIDRLLTMAVDNADRLAFAHDRRPGRAGGKVFRSNDRPEIAEVGFAVYSEAPGSVWKVLVEEGSEIQAGDTVMIVKSMKMEISIQSTASGVVRTISVRPGQVVNAGDQVCILQES